MNTNPNINLSDDQQQAVDKLCEWYEDANKDHQDYKRGLLNEAETPSQVFRIFGFAGTGKTTCVNSMIQSLGLQLHEVAFAAFTGKAASVMTRKGTPATTIHRLIYKLEVPSKEQTLNIKKKLSNETLAPKERKELEQQLRNMNKPRFHLNEESELRNKKLLILDECSMVNDEIGRDLLSFGVPTLVVGDPGQLPPIEGTGFFTNCDPDAMLEQIHRQAEGSPIIEAATRARRGTPFPAQGSKQSIPTDELQNAGIVLTGKHATRKSINARIRQGLGFNDVLPVEGDKVICTRNCYDVRDEEDRAHMMFNGEIFRVLKRGSLYDNYIELTVRNEDGGPALNVRALTYQFLGQEEPDFWQKEDKHEFDFGYCITVHKSQGSQWENVMLVDDGMFNWGKKHALNRRRWLYTGITRAAEVLYVYR